MPVWGARVVHKRGENPSHLWQASCFAGKCAQLALDTIQDGSLEATDRQPGRDDFIAD
jgi:hypothetical protein